MYIFFEGGNTQWLRECIKNCGIEEYLKKLLETRIWIGASAGSCVLCPTICNSVQDLYDENVEDLPTDGLSFVDFQFMPHLNNDMCPNIKKDNIVNASKNLKEIDGQKIYVLDDNSAIFVNEKSVKVISEGEYFEIVK